MISIKAIAHIEFLDRNAEGVCTLLDFGTLVSSGTVRVYAVTSLAQLKALDEQHIQYRIVWRAEAP